MPRYAIRSTDGSYKSAEITATDAGAALNVVGQLGCQEADILEDERYLFSANLNGNGVWCIFQRDHAEAAGPISACG